LALTLFDPSLPVSWHLAMELPPDDSGPTIDGQPNVLSLTHLAVPDLKTPVRKRLETLDGDQFLGSALKNFYLLLCVCLTVGVS
jgi:hypothetical protein